MTVASAGPVPDGVGIASIQVIAAGRGALMHRNDDPLLRWALLSWDGTKSAHDDWATRAAAQRRNEVPDRWVRSDVPSMTHVGDVYEFAQAVRQSHPALGLAKIYVIEIVGV